MSPKPIVLPLRTSNDGLNARVSEETGLSCPEPTLTQQQFKEDSDPNTIIAKFVRTGDVSLLSGTSEPRYGDFSFAPSYFESMNTVIAAQQSFDALPDSVKERFNHEPSKLMEFVFNDANHAEAVRLGLLKSDLPVDIQVSQGELDLPAKPAKPTKSVESDQSST